MDLDNKVLEGLTLITSLFTRCSLYRSLYPPGDLSTDSTAEATRSALERAIVEVYFHSIVFLGYVIYSGRRSSTIKTLGAVFSLNAVEKYLQSLKDCEKDLVRVADDSERIATSNLRIGQQKSLELIRETVMMHAKLQHFL